MRPYDDENLGAATELEQFRGLARLLDSSIRLPGGFRIGLDGIIGLLPGIGDAVGTALSGYLIVLAARAGTPKSILIRMVYNVALESIVGVIPVVGDLFDFAWKANERNLALFSDYLHEPSKNRTRHRVIAVAPLLFVGLAITGIVGISLALLYALVKYAVAG